MYLKTSLSSLIAMIHDVQNHHNWVYGNSYGEILEQTSPMMSVCYTQTDLPWPVSDRDAVSSIQITQDPVSKEVVIVSEPKDNLIPEKEGYIRIKNFKAVWHLIPDIEGLVRVEYELYIDPGGSIPSWFVNLTLKKGPYRTMLNMQKEIQCSKYKNAKLDYILEPGSVFHPDGFEVKNNEKKK